MRPGTGSTKPKVYYLVNVLLQPVGSLRNVNVFVHINKFCVHTDNNNTCASNLSTQKQRYELAEHIHPHAPSMEYTLKDYKTERGTLYLGFCNRVQFKDQSGQLLWRDVVVDSYLCRWECCSYWCIAWSCDQWSAHCLVTWYPEPVPWRNMCWLKQRKRESVFKAFPKWCRGNSVGHCTQKYRVVEWQNYVIMSTL